MFLSLTVDEAAMSRTASEQEKELLTVYKFNINSRFIIVKLYLSSDSNAAIQIFHRCIPESIFHTIFHSYGN